MILKKQAVTFFLIGGFVYYQIEILFRGYSHWTMFLLGGICMVFIYAQGEAWNWQEPLWKSVLRATIFAIAMEFIFGIIINKWLNLAIWDYSDQPCQIFEIVCLPYMILFSAICLGGILLCGVLNYVLFHGKKPDYHIL